MRKVVKILTISFAAILCIVASITAFAYFSIYSVVADKFNAKDSANPKATSYFMHAAVLSTWVEYQRELGTSYDSLTLKPVLHLRDYLFERGESLTAEDNAEDAFWWVQNYAEFYEFLRDEPNNKYTIENLDFRKKEEVVNRLYIYILKLGAHDIRGITQTKYNNKLSIASNIVAAHLRSVIELY